MRLITLILLISFLSCENKSSESKKIIEKKTLNEPIQWVNYKSKKNSKRKRVVLISGDEEYRSE